MSHAPLSALIVGAGLMGRWHAHAIKASGAVVIGVVDTDTARAAALAALYGAASVFTELTRALSSTMPNVVHVCTPLATHRGLSDVALRADCHVIVEKPVTATAADAESLCALAKARGRHLVPVHQFPFQQGVRDLLARRDQLGGLVHLELTMASAGAVGSRDTDDVVSEILPHCLSLTQTLTASPGGDVRLADLPWHVARVRAGEWRISTHTDGLSIAYLISMSVRPTCAELRVYGTKASAVVDLFHGFSVIDTGPVSRASKAARPFRVAGRSMVAASANLARRGLRAESAYPGLQTLVHRAYLAFAGRGEVPISTDALLDVARTRDQLIALSGWSTP